MAFQSINSVALAEICLSYALQTKEQGLLHKDGKGLNSQFTNLPLASKISVPFVPPVDMKMRQIGADTNGGFFNNATYSATSSSVDVDMTYVIDQPIKFARIANEQGGYDMVNQISKNLNKGIKKEITAFRLATQICKILNQANETGYSDMVFARGASETGMKTLSRLGAILDKGDSTVGIDAVDPTERQYFVTASLKEDLLDSSQLINNQIGQMMLGQGNLQYDAKTTGYDLNDGYLGIFNGTWTTLVSDVVLNRAREFIKIGSTAMTAAQMATIKGIIVSGYQTISPINIETIKVADVPDGHGWYITPLVNAGCATFGARIGGIALSNGSSNPATSTNKATIVARGSQA